MTPTNPNDSERPVLEREDARLVARVRDAWAPAPMTSVQRAAFDARLQERVERAQRRVGLWPALGAGLAAAALAALAALLFVRGANGPDTPPVVVATTAPATAQAATSAWAADLLYAETEDDDERALDDDGLPAEYAAIAGMLLDD
jgi:hypothetical protein